MAPKIIIDIWTRMHPQAMRQAEQQLVNQFRKIGKEGSNALSDEFIKQTPKMQRALKKVADETANASKKERDLATDRTARANATERAAQLEDRIREKSAAHNRVIAESAVLEKELKQVRAEHGQITRGIETREKNLHDRRVELNAKTRELGLAEIDLRNARDRGDDAAVLALEEHLHQQRDEQSKMLANIVRKETDLQRQRDTLGGVTNRLTGLEYQLDDAQTKRHETLVDLKAAENDYTQAKRESVGVDQEAIRRSDEVVRAHDRRLSALKRVADWERRSSRSGGGSDDKESRFGRYGAFGGTRRSTLGSILTELPGVPSGKAGAIIGTPIVLGLASAAEGLVTASQALTLLPALATAAAAGIGTLAIGFHGLGQAIQDMGDPKKFAEDLQTLGPAAQQVALEVQALVQGPLGDLKRMVEDKLFAGIPEKLHQLTATFLPGANKLTGGISDSMNAMFDNFAGALSTAGGQSSINTIIDNIVRAFQHLEPAIAPFTDALLRITSTGSDFLPKLADGVARAAEAFDKFITQAQQDGSLQNFIQKGIDASKALIDVLSQVGRDIYEVFGNKTPEEFKANLMGIWDAAKQIAEAIRTLADVANDVLTVMDRIGISAGDLVNMFIAWESIKGVTSLLTSLTLIETALGSKLPAAAEKGATGITAALSRIAIPVWIAMLLDHVADVNSGDFNPGQSSWSHIALGPLGDKLFPAGPGDPGNPGPDSQRPPATITDPKTGLPSTQANAPAGNRESGGVPGIPGVTNPSTGLPYGQNERAGGAPALPGHGLHWDPKLGWVPDANMPPGVVAPNAPANIGRGGPYAVPPVPQTAADNNKKIKEALAGLNPNDFAIDPNQSMSPTLGGGPSGAAGPGSRYDIGPLQYGTDPDNPYEKPGYGFFRKDPDAIGRDTANIQQDAARIQKESMQLAAMQKAGVSTQLELLEQEQQVADAKQKLAEDQQKLARDQLGTWQKVATQTEKLSEKMGQIGAGLDADLGISKGLPGIADNIIRFVGNLATAPLQAQLAAAGGDKSGAGTGLGLFGMFASSMGLSTGGITSVTGVPNPSGQPIGPFPVGPGGVPSSTLGGAASIPSGFPSILHDTGSVPSGPQSQAAAALIQQYFGSQLRQPIGGSRDNNTAPNTHDKGLSIDIPIGEDQKSLGDQIEQMLQANAQALGLKYTIWQNIGKNVGGGTFNQSGHMDHIDAHFNGQGVTGPLGAPTGAPGGLGAGPSAAGATPVFVVNMPGGGVGGAGGGGSAPLGSPGAPAGYSSVASSFSGLASKFGPPGSPQANAGVIYNMALQRGYTPDEATAIVAYAVGESGLNASSSGGPQGGSGEENTVRGLFQQKPAFAQGGGIDPSQRNDPVANTYAYLNQLQKNRNLPIEQALPATSVGGPLAGGDAAQPWGPLLQRAKGLIGQANAYGQGQGALPGPAPTVGAPSGGPGGGPTLGAPGGGGNVGGPGAMPGPPSALPQTGAIAPGSQGWQPQGGGFNGVGGLPLAAGMAAASMGTGGMGGAAASTMMALVNRTIGYVGQLGAIGVGGLLETFGLHDSALGDLSKSWIGKIASGFAGARPAIPNTAGGEGGAPGGQPGADPNAQQPQGNAPLLHIENYNQNTGQSNMQGANALAWQAQTAGQR